MYVCLAAARCWLSVQSLEGRTEGHRQLLVDLITHGADLANPALPFATAQAWEERVVAEFREQAGKEEALGLPVAPHMQNLGDTRTRAKNQVNFIDFVVSPLWTRIVDQLPGLQPCVTCLLDNRKRYSELAGMTSAVSSSSAGAAGAASPGPAGVGTGVGQHGSAAAAESGAASATATTAAGGAAGPAALQLARSPSFKKGSGSSSSSGS